MSKNSPEPEELYNISLRRLDVSDIDDFMVWGTDENVAKYCSWDPFTSKEAGIEYITKTIIPHPYCHAICIHNRPIGLISVTPNSDRCRGEVGYVLARGYWGKGIATKAVKMVATAIFEEWPQLERLEALVDADNLGSQKVLLKAGFQREAALRKYFLLKGVSSRDIVMFSILSTDVKV